MPDFCPTAGWPVLKARAELLKRLRQFFDGCGFLEVETPLLSADVVVDRHLDPFSTTLCADPRRPSDGRTLWLQTSPEFGMKRLMAAGGEAIYQVTRAFRNGEQGRLHNPEFTLVEWYRRGDDLKAGMQLLSDLAEVLLNRGSAEQVGYSAAFQRHLAIEPHTASREELASVAKAQGIAGNESMQSGDRDAWLDLLLTERIEPHLGRSRPSILYDYPASQSALAKLRHDKALQVEVAERFELYVDGIELANGYHELLDADLLRERNRHNNMLRLQDGKPCLPEQSRLLEAMDAGLPPCSGCALGFDRLAMVALGQHSLNDVLAFPVDRA